LDTTGGGGGGASGSLVVVLLAVVKGVRVPPSALHAGTAITAPRRSALGSNTFTKLSFTRKGLAPA
jgi:hypothetical protein